MFSPTDLPQVRTELHAWQQQMQRPPSLLNRFARRVQIRLNALLPERVHQAITAAIKQMVRGVLFGSKHTTSKPLPDAPFAAREVAVRARIRDYRTMATAEGAVTGAGGFLLGLADFPLLLSLKLKLLFDTAALYGYDVHDYTERLYLLHVFQLAFSSQHNRNLTYQRLAHWDTYRLSLPLNPEEFDWRTFQQEYRDYIDLAKMAQLVPVIGAAVGAVANYKRYGAARRNGHELLPHAAFCGEGTGVAGASFLVVRLMHCKLYLNPGQAVPHVERPTDLHYRYATVEAPQRPHCWSKLRCAKRAQERMGTTFYFKRLTVQTVRKPTVGEGPL